MCRRPELAARPTYWSYERDEFNRIVMEDVPELVQETDHEGNPVFDEETHEPIMVETGKIIKNARMKLAEGYDPSLQDTYVERKDRKEWACVFLHFGQTF